MICPKCGSNIVLRTNNTTKNKFLGCSNFPNCTFTTEYINKDENKKLIQNIINKFETNIREELQIPNFINVQHIFDDHMEHATTCKAIDKNNYIIKWNIEFKRKNLSIIVMELAHEYRHVYQIYFEKFKEKYNFNQKWRLRPEEDDAINFMNHYINNIILNLHI